MIVRTGADAIKAIAPGLWFECPGGCRQVVQPGLWHTGFPARPGGDSPLPPAGAGCACVQIQASSSVPHSHSLTSQSCRMGIMQIAPLWGAGRDKRRSHLRLAIDCQNATFLGNLGPFCFLSSPRWVVWVLGNSNSKSWRGRKGREKAE